MKRPFALIGFTSFAVTLVAAFIGRNDVSFSLLALFSVLTVISLIFRKFRQELTLPLFFLTAAVSCLLVLCFGTDKAEVQSLAGDNVAVNATVYEAPYRNNGTARYYVVCKLASVGENEVSGKIRLSFSPTNDGIDPDSLEIGNNLSFTAKVYVPGKGEKSIERYFAGENILLGAYGAQNVSITEPEVRSLGYYFHLIRSYVTGVLASNFSDGIAGVLTGILTGDKSCLDGELYEAFRNSGVAHLMAVSGLHLSVWVFFLGGIIPENGKHSKLKYLLLLFAVFFIMLLAGMSESVKRAGFMSVIHILGKLGKRKSDSLNSLGLAVFLMIVYNPACVLSISLQLSFLSTLSILTLGKLYMEKSKNLLRLGKLPTAFGKLIRLGADSFCISISVLIFTFPVLIYSFGGISTVSAWTNIMLVPVTSPLLVLAGVYVIFSKISFVSYPVGIIVKFLADYTIGVTKAFSAVRNAFLPFGRDTLGLYIVAAVLIAVFTLLVVKKPFAGRFTISAVSLVLCVLLVFVYERGNEKVRIHLFEVNGENSVVLERDEKAILIGDLPTYEKGLLTSSLEEKGIKLYGGLKKEESFFVESFSDGKRIYSDGIHMELLNGITAESCDEGLIISAFGNYIGIFPFEDLQESDKCDIIIKTDMAESKDIVVVSGEKEFLLSQQKNITLIFEKSGSYYIRGENSWRNLMKNN